MPTRGFYRRMRWRIGIRDRGVQRAIRVSRERVLEEVEPVNLVPGMLSTTGLSRLVRRLGVTESSVCVSFRVWIMAKGVRCWCKY